LARCSGIDSSHFERLAMMGMTFRKPNLQLVEDLEQASQDAARAVSDALPKIAEKARQTGRQVADMAASATNRVGDVAASAAGRIAHDPHVKAATTALLSSGKVQDAGRGLLKFARRRPALLIVGGVAVVSLLVALGRRAKSANAAAQDDDAIGEGSYKGARDYRVSTLDYLDGGSRRVARDARKTKEALDSDERTALVAAEEEGKRHARS
jgi:hypothetical protein